MRFRPDRNELLALAGVWLLWPALLFLMYAAAGDRLNGALPLHVRAAIHLLSGHAMWLPSLTGTVLLAMVARYVRCPETRQCACHALTLGAFAYCVLVLVLLFI